MHWKKEQPPLPPPIDPSQTFSMNNGRGAVESLGSQLIENLDLSGEREVIEEFQAEKGHD